MSNRHPQRIAAFPLPAVLLVATVVSAETPAFAQAARFVDTHDTISVTGESSGERHFTIEARFRLLECGPPSGRIYSEQFHAREDKALGYSTSGVYGHAWTRTGYPTLRHEVVLPHNRWHHLAFVRDGDDERLYLNGDLVASREELPPIRNASGSPRSIGAFLYTQGGPFAQALGCNLDYVRISDSVRYAGASYDPPREADLVVDGNTQLLYFFDEAEGADVVHDESPQSNDGLVGVGDFEDATAPTFGTMLCRADLNGSCDVGFPDLLGVLSAFGACEGDCNEDLDGNGQVGFPDVLRVLAAWGPCPDR